MTRRQTRKLSHMAGPRDAGVATVEMLIWAAVAVILLGLAVYVIRAVSASIDVADAAAAAARAASLTHAPAEARTAATAAVTANLGTSGAACHQPRTSFDVSRFHAGGTVTVSITCVVDVADLPLGSLGRHTVHASATAPIDPYTAVGP
jgi:Flp pilus assembly protein TadG